jgi:glucose-6-phosphate dehydrogenase assembly protein OpcA
MGEDGAAPSEEHMSTPDLQYGIDAAAIERQLDELWKQAGEGYEGGVIRACALNLMVYLPDPSQLRAIEDLLADVAASHPCRAILMIADRGAQTAISAWASSRCALQPATSKQVCCEQITISAGGEAIDEMPSAAVQLLLSDLPVYLWWRARPTLADSVFKKLVDYSDRVIIDSADFADQSAGLIEMANIISHGSKWTAFSDLNWARLSAWRALLAGFYDVAANRPYLNSMDCVQIEYGALEGSAIPARALLIAGWLAGRLEWNKESVRRDGDSLSIAFQAPGGRPIRLRLSPSGDPRIEPGHIAQVTLEVRSGPSAHFKVKRSWDGTRLETESMLEGSRRPARALDYESRGDSELLSKELDILGRDRVYEQAVSSAADLAAAIGAV